MDNLKIDPDSEIDENYDATLNNKSNYSYFIETLLTKNIGTADILKNNANMYGQGILHILCYHVTKNSKYPFIQFLLEKLPYCNDIIQEKLV